MDMAAEETARSAAVLDGGGAVVTGGGTKADGRGPGITDTRLIGSRILPGVSLRE
jgi:hypothetical protein